MFVCWLKAEDAKDHFAFKDWGQFSEAELTTVQSTVLPAVRIVLCAQNNECAWAFEFQVHMPTCCGSTMLLYKAI